jgi:thiol:disulfide interchange protein DsbD
VGVGSELTGRRGFSGSFFSGVLATVVATPCAAPFLAPALGAALTLPPVTSFLVFTFIGIGLSLPYLLLSAFPALIDRLPRPGPWMETFKQFMSFLLYATVAFLLWVLAGQLTDSGGYPVFSFLKVLLSLVILAFALWVFGRWAAYHRKMRVRVAGTTTAVLLTMVALGTGFSGTNRPDANGPSIQWETWEPGKAASLAAEGRIVYVDFTARWCVTCQTNKATVFSSKSVLEKFDELDVVTLKADWTNQDPRISETLASYGRSAVPFNLVFGPGLESPLPLPELLTPGIVLDAIEDAAVR